MRKIYFYIHIAIKNNFNYHFKIISDQGYYYTKHKDALETACMNFNRDTRVRLSSHLVRSLPHIPLFSIVSAHRQKKGKKKEH